MGCLSGLVALPVLLLGMAFRVLAVALRVGTGGFALAARGVAWTLHRLIPQERP